MPEVRKLFCIALPQLGFPLQSALTIKAMHFFPVDALLLNAGAGHSI
jgi:hypothetical protein